ncbi:MAG: helix-turn-helix domain-containing protein [Streptosporangiaceae bacterium]
MTSGDRQAAEILADLAEGLGLRQVEAGEPSQAGRPGLVMIDVGGRRVLVEVKRVAQATPARVSRVVAGEARQESMAVLRVLVADRVPERARAELRSHGWGWLDLRGHLHLAGQGIFVDADVPSALERPERADAFSGPAGLEVACSLLLNPGARRGVRDLARELGRSPSTVSQILGALRRQGLAEDDGTAIVPDLFWETAGSWQPREAALAEPPRLGDGGASAALRLGLQDAENETGWALTGTLAAAAYGAPVAARSDYPPEFYIPDMAVLRRATRLLGQASDAGNRAASVRVAPVPVICQRRVAAAGPRTPPHARRRWPLASPLFAALDLAQDPGRGREILDGWQPPQPWHRVW